jgi:hypothetical protein
MEPTHEDWQRAVKQREQAALDCVRALLDGKTDRAMQLALKSDEADTLVWSISKRLDG